MRHIMFWWKKKPAPHLEPVLATEQIGQYTHRRCLPDGTSMLSLRTAANEPWLAAFTTSATLPLAELVRLQRVYEENEICRDVFAEMNAA